MRVVKFDSWHAACWRRHGVIDWLHAYVSKVLSRSAYEYATRVAIHGRVVHFPSRLP